MPTPRLTGRRLAAVRALAETPLVHALRAQALRDYGVGALLALPADTRYVVEVVPYPVRGAAPRRFGEGNLPRPATDAVTVEKLHAAYVSGVTTPRAVVDRIAARLGSKRFGHAVHSPFVALDLDRARADADTATARYAAGRALGPLDGVPVPVKDHVHVAGLSTRGGTAYVDHVAPEDGFAVRVLRGQGALVFGKTHTTEWGMTPTGQNPHFDMPRNVWAPGLCGGGSSTGAAAAVALGLAPVALGSDGGGSIRVPSALQGVYGLKPTWVRVGRTGDIYGESSVAHVGPIGASTGDLVEWLAPFATTPDLDDPVHGWQPDRDTAPTAWRAALGRGVKGCRIGIVRADWEDCDPRLARAAMGAVDALVADGATLVDVNVPLAPLANAIGMLVIGPEVAANLSDDLAVHGKAMSDDLRLVLRLLMTMSSQEVAAAARTRAMLRRQLAAGIAGVDVIVMPTVAVATPRYPLAEDGVAISDADAVRGLCRYAFLGNLTGLPAGTVPVGLVDGLPAGLQILGDAWDEASVLAVMAHVERLGVGKLPRAPGWEGLLG